MEIKSFQALRIAQQQITKVQRIAVVGADDSSSLLSVFDQRFGKYLIPSLIGPQKEIERLLNELNLKQQRYQIYDCSTPAQAAEQGVELVRQGKVDILMKGHVQTQEFLRPIVSKETGILAEQLLSHVSLNQLEHYPKLLAISDGGMNPEPKLATKIKIAEHGLELLYRLGYRQPRLGILAAAEVTNPKIRASREAELLQHHFQDNPDYPCYVDGPISFDLAVSPEIAGLKNYQSEVAGQADLLIGPDMTAVNLLGKSIVVFGEALMIGVVVGARVPLVVASRGSTVEEKYLSIALASVLDQGGVQESE